MYYPCICTMYTYICIYLCKYTYRVFLIIKKRFLGRLVILDLDHLGTDLVYLYFRAYDQVYTKLKPVLVKLESLISHYLPYIYVNILTNTYLYMFLNSNMHVWMNANIQMHISCITLSFRLFLARSRSRSRPFSLIACEAPKKLFGSRFWTPSTPFCLICTISSELKRIFDLYPFEVAGVDIHCNSLEC